MKNVICSLSIAVYLTLFSSCTEEPDFSSQGILVLNIFDSNSGNPVANAKVIAYRSIDDWAFDERRVDIFISNEEGQVIMAEMREGLYYFDIVVNDKNNWENPLGHYISDGSISESFEGIRRNINGIVSTTEGREWQILRVYDDNGNNLPQYECMTDNIVNFTKAGAYEMHDQNIDCDSIPDFFEASWWGIGEEYIGLIYNDGEAWADLYISQLTNSRFIATEYKGAEIINYEYQLLD